MPPRESSHDDLEVFFYQLFMEKNFDGWIQEKKHLEQFGRTNLVFHEREVWWCSIGINLGDEQDGKNQLYERPVLVIKKFNNKIAWVLPMSTKVKEGRYYYHLQHEQRVYSILLSQMRLLSVKRFRRFIRKISPHQFSLVQDKLVQILKGQ